MKRLFWLILILLVILPVQAQATSYDIALQRIEEAKESGATVLSLGGFELTELPSGIGQLENLQELYLYSNFLSSLPAEIGQLKNLEALSVSYNDLTSLPPEIGQLSNLQKLDCGGNKLRILPAEIGQLTSLEELSLNGNLLPHLPSEIGQLSNLQVLYLNNNQLTTLPSEIGQLTNLYQLSLGYNQLSSLPTEIGQLTNLCDLGLQNNNLSHLPNSLGNLTYLIEWKHCFGLEPGYYLYLDGNPLITPPQEVIDEGTEAILDYLSNQALWHIRKLMIGAASGIALILLVFFGLYWRNRQMYGKKKKRA